MMSSGGSADAEGFSLPDDVESAGSWNYAARGHGVESWLASILLGRVEDSVFSGAPTGSSSPPYAPLPEKLHCVTDLLVPTTFLTGSYSILVTIVLLVLLRLSIALRRAMWDTSGWRLLHALREGCATQEASAGESPSASSATPLPDSAPTGRQCLGDRKALSCLRFYARSPHEKRLALAEGGACKRHAEVSFSDAPQTADIVVAQEGSLGTLKQLLEKAERLTSQISELARAQGPLTSPDNFAKLALLQRQCQARQRELDVVQECIEGLTASHPCRETDVKAAGAGNTPLPQRGSVSGESQNLSMSPGFPVCGLRYSLCLLFSSLRSLGERAWALARRPAPLYFTKVIAIAVIASRISRFPSLSYIMLSESPWKSYSMEHLVLTSATADSSGPDQRLFTQTSMQELLPHIARCNGILNHGLHDEATAARVLPVGMARRDAIWNAWAIWIDFILSCLFVSIVDAGLRHLIREVPGSFNFSLLYKPRQSLGETESTKSFAGAGSGSSTKDV